VDIQTLIVRITQLIDLLWPFAHPKEVVAALLNDSIGLLLKVWFGFILTTTDFESCLLYTSPSPRDLSTSRMPSSA